MVKLSPRDVLQDQSLQSMGGWLGMNVRWLFTEETVGSEALTLNMTSFEPGGTHELHRHPGCEEVLYLIEGSGLQLTEAGEQPIEAGEVAYIAAGEWHGFRNDSGSAVRVLCCYGGAGGLRAAGYELLADRERR